MGFWGESGMTAKRLEEIRELLVECEPSANCVKCDAAREILGELARVTAERDRWPKELSKVTALGNECSPEEVADFISDLTNVAIERLNYGGEQKARAEKAEAALKEAKDLFWPAITEIDQHIYEIRNGKNREYVAAHVAAIQELALASRPSQEWISVEERMPEDFKGVIVSHDYDIGKRYVWFSMRVSGKWVHCTSFSCFRQGIEAVCCPHKRQS